MKKFGTRLVAVSMAVLFCIGFAVGFFCMRFFLEAYPDTVKADFHLILQIGCGGVLGLLLLISVNPILTLGKLIFVTVKKAVIYRKPVEIAGVFIGLSIGALVGFFVYQMLSIFLQIAAVKYIVAVLIGLFAGVLCAAACPKWLTGGACEAEQSLTYIGYLVEETALDCPACVDFLNRINLGNVFISTGTVERVLRGGNTRRIDNLNRLEGDGTVKRVRFDKEGEALLDFAKTRRYKLVTQGKTESEACMDIGYFLKQDGVCTDKALTFKEKDIKIE